jgi:hypothetical protein
MPIEAKHIADVSLAQHFHATEADAPANGKIKINKNVYDVTFADGRVNAKFLTGNAFTNFFRSKTLGRFTRTLQAQYDTWLDQQRQIEEAKAAELARTLGFEDNPDAAKVKAVADEFKAILEETNPAGKETYLARLGDIVRLAELRNTLTRNPSGAACNKAVTDAGFLTHFDDNAKKLDEKGKKGYVLNMLDAIVNGFLAAASQMTDKKTQAVEFLRNFDGACVEAKNDNIQDWLSNAAGIGKASRSDSSHDLAYSVTAEFAAIAEEVTAPYYEEARKSCEAEVRAACTKKGITDEAEIARRIESKASMLVLDKDDEIKPKVREALETYGKFAAYDALIGAKRPITKIGKNPENGKWTITTLVDKTGAPILKPVSAFDIDKDFSKLVDMYLEDAIAMGGTEKRTAVAEPVFATREDLRAEAVLEQGALYQSGGADLAQLAERVKAEFSYTPEISDEEFREKVKAALDEIMTAKKEDPAETKELFKRFFNNHASAAYFDRTSDADRLVHLVARRAETLVDHEKACLSKIPDASVRCAKMMQNAFQKLNWHVNAGKAAIYIERTLKQIVHHSFHGKEGNRVSQEAKQLLGHLMLNGILITDHPIYDLGHRAAGGKEVRLHKNFELLMRCMQRYALAPQNWYMHKINA